MRVLIAGAGIAGLALARALRRRGVNAEVVERMTEWQPIGAGLYLPANAVRALGELGVGTELAAHANPIERQRLLDHRGRLLADIDLARLWDGVGGCVAIEREALHALLRADVPVRLGLSVEALEDGETPRVSFSDGSTGSYDLVVGADGVHSTIRSLAFGDHPAGTVGQASWRFLADGFPELTDWTAMLGRGRTFLTVSLGDGDVYCYADVNTATRGAPRARIGGSGSPTSPTRCRACSTRPVRRTSRRSRRSRRRPGPRAASCSSATPPTPAHRTWRRARRWRSRTRSCSPSS